LFLPNGNHPTFCVPSVSARGAIVFTAELETPGLQGNGLWSWQAGVLSPIAFSNGSLQVTPDDRRTVASIFFNAWFGVYGTGGIHGQNSSDQLAFTALFLDHLGLHRGGGLFVTGAPDPTPLTIGNRVWHDGNGDGIQDVNELGIADVTVRLREPISGVILATQTTDVDGLYVFDDDKVAGGLQPGQSYDVCLDHALDYLAGGPLFGLTVASFDVGTSDGLDSDGVPVSLTSTCATVTAAADGHRDCLDFGFAPTCGPTDFRCIGVDEGKLWVEWGQPDCAGTLALVSVVDGRQNPWWATFLPGFVIISVGTSLADVSIVSLGSSCSGRGNVHCIRSQCNLPSPVHFYGQLLFYPTAGNPNPEWLFSPVVEVINP
jgi:hypothetical protein